MTVDKCKDLLKLKVHQLALDNTSKGYSAIFKSKGLAKKGDHMTIVDICFNPSNHGLCTDFKKSVTAKDYSLN